MAGERGGYQMPKLARIILGVLLAAGCASCVHADTISLFTISGTGCSVLEGSPGCIAPIESFAGDLAVDITTGIVVAINVLIDGFDFSPFFGGIAAFTPNIDLCNPLIAECLRLDLVTPTDSLVGYDGGAILGVESGIFDTNNFQEFDILGGTITPVVATPEPSSLALILAGFGALLVMRKRMGHSHSSAV
jgi:hypothetical protein